MNFLKKFWRFKRIINMFDDRIKFAINNFFQSDCFLTCSTQYELKEEQKNGKALIKLNVNTPENICVQHFDNEKIWDFKFLKIKKAVDHFLLKKSDEHWELHMIEIKRTVDSNNWLKIKNQISESYLKIKSLIVMLGISLEDNNIIAYTAYENDTLSLLDHNNSIINRAMSKFGSKAINIKDEWQADFIDIPIITAPYGKEVFVKIRHKKIKIFYSKENEQLEGILNLDKDF